METDLIAKKIEELESELHWLKNRVTHSSSKDIVSVKGLWKGISITENDIKKAKKSLFPSSQ